MLPKRGVPLSQEQPALWQNQLKQTARTGQHPGSFAHPVPTNNRCNLLNRWKSNQTLPLFNHQEIWRSFDTEAGTMLVNCSLALSPASLMCCLSVIQSSDLQVCHLEEGKVQITCPCHGAYLAISLHNGILLVYCQSWTILLQNPEYFT